MRRNGKRKGPMKWSSIIPAQILTENLISAVRRRIAAGNVIITMRALPTYELYAYCKFLPIWMMTQWKKHFNKEKGTCITFFKVPPLCKSNTRCIIIRLQCLDTWNGCISCSRKILQSWNRKPWLCALDLEDLATAEAHILFDGRSPCYSYPLPTSSLKWTCLS